MVALWAVAFHPRYHTPTSCTFARRLWWFLWMSSHPAIYNKHIQKHEHQWISGDLLTLTRSFLERSSCPRGPECKVTATTDWVWSRASPIRNRRHLIPCSCRIRCLQTNKQNKHHETWAITKSYRDVIHPKTATIMGQVEDGLFIIISQAHIHATANWRTCFLLKEG